MTHPVTLAATHHDPEGRLREQAQRLLPHLNKLFPRIVVHLTSTTQQRSAADLEKAGALVTWDTTMPEGLTQLGRPRRFVIAQALEAGADSLLFCDFDRMLHWSEFYPDELEAVLRRIPASDFTVLGRTPRAFQSHPRVQRDTEAIINQVFWTLSGTNWDTGAGARGMSRRAVAALLQGCDDQSVGVDVTWPLFLQQAGGFSLDYIATEGMEFETADRFTDQVAELGGLEAWIRRLDDDPGEWVKRLELARVEVEAMLPYRP
jgi:hypothetical protein